MFIAIVVLINLSAWRVFYGLGMMEALLFSKAGREGLIKVTKNKNPHAALNVFRLALAVLCVSFYFLIGHWAELLIVCVGTGLSFMLWHDGKFYQVYKELGIAYPKGFQDESKTTDAEISWPFCGRITLAITGILLQAVGLPILNHFLF